MRRLDTRVARWGLVTAGGMLLLAAGALRLARPTVAPTLAAFLIGFGIFMAFINGRGIMLAVRKTPIARSDDFLEGLRKSMTAYSTQGAWTAKHPWLMTGILVATWFLVCIFSANRWAAYSGP